MRIAGRSSGTVGLRKAAVLLGLVCVTPIVTSCDGHGSVTDRVVISETQATPGQTLAATLEIDNPGPTIDLTRLATVRLQRDGKASYRRTGCQPGFGIALGNSRHPANLAFGLPCSGQPFLIRHGTTRLHARVLTTFNGCAAPGGTVTSSTPPCRSGNAPPPLPLGTYRTQVIWSELVPLPEPEPVVVLLVASARSPTGTGGPSH